MAGYGLSYMAYLAVFLSDVEEVSPKREFVNIGAKLEGETKERRNRCGRWCECPSRRASFGCRDAVRGLRMVSLIHQQLPSKVGTPRCWSFTRAVLSASS